MLAVAGASGKRLDAGDLLWTACSSAVCINRTDRRDRRRSQLRPRH